MAINGVLVGLAAYLVCQLQSVLNASARMIFQLRRSDHITLTRLPDYTGCASQGASSFDAIQCNTIKKLIWCRLRYKSASGAVLFCACWSLCRRMKFFILLLHVTWVRSSVCLIYHAGRRSLHSVSTDRLVVPYHSNYPLLAAEHLRSLLLRHGFMYRGLAVIWLYATSILFVFTLHYNVILYINIIRHK